MAGHSKWANIKHRKQVVDAKKGVRFQAIVKQIKVAARENNNPATNSQLRAIIANAKKLNCPQHLINRALQTARTTNQVTTYLYEVKFARQIVLLIKIATTEKAAKVLSELRRLVNRFNAELCPPNTLLFAFQTQFICETSAFSDDQLLVILDLINPQTVINKATLTLFTLRNRDDLLTLKTFCQRAAITVFRSQEVIKPFTPITVSEADLQTYETFVAALKQTYSTITITNNLANQVE